MPASRYLANTLLDFLFREQAYNPPASSEIAILTVAPDNSDAYTELSATGYARVSVAASLAAWSGSQGAGTTTASTGSGAYAESSNNAAVVFHASIPANWTGCVAIAFFDGTSDDNMLDWYYLTDSDGNPVTRNYAIGDAVSFAIGAIKRRLADG
jgi:hypothetical protein